MARAKALQINLRLTGARETLAAFRALPKDASTELRVASKELAGQMVGWIVARARSDSAQSALLAPTVRAVSDRVPAVQVGGSRMLARSSGGTVAAWRVLFGANFGASRWPQFRPHRGRGQQDYFIWVSIDEHADEIDKAWNAAADKVIRKWSQGGETK